MSSSFLYCNVSLFSLFRNHYYVLFQKPECFLLVEIFFFFSRDYFSIVQLLFLPSLFLLQIAAVLRGTSQWCRFVYSWEGNPHF